MSWDYQSCTELVSNVDTNGVTDMFPNAPYDFPALEVRLPLNLLLSVLHPLSSPLPLPVLFPLRDSHMFTRHTVQRPGV
jgi:hypothetical protein